MLTVEPSEYYPIIDKLFASRIADALEALGASVVEIHASVEPAESTLNVKLKITVEEEGALFSTISDSIVRAMLDKISLDATSTFGKLYGVQFEVPEFELIKVPSKQSEKPTKLIVDAPPEIRDQLERLGKGLIITLKDWEVEFSSLVLRADKLGLKIVLKVKGDVFGYDKESLRERLLTKAESFLKTIFKRPYPIRVDVISPGHKELGMILKREEEIAKEAEELTKNPEIRRLMEALGKSPSP